MSRSYGKSTSTSSLLKPRFSDLIRDSDGGWAPAAVSDHMTQEITFRGGMDKLSLHVCIPMFQLVENTSTGGNAANCMYLQSAFTQTASALTSAACNLIGLNPYRFPVYQTSGTNAGLASFGVGIVDAGFLTRISQAFARYRFVGPAALHYEPQASSQSAVGFAVGFVDDPAHPTNGFNNSLANAGGTAVGIYTANIDNSPNSVFFAAWNAWSLKIHPDQDWKYNYFSPNYANATTTPNYTDHSDIRYACAGAIAVTNSGGAAFVARGRVFLEATIEYRDPVPVAISSISLYGNLRKSLLLLNTSEISELLRKRKTDLDALFKPSSSSSSSSSSSRKDDDDDDDEEKEMRVISTDPIPKTVSKKKA